MDKYMIDLFAFCFMLLRENKFEDIAISGAKTLMSIKNFNTANDMYEYVANNNVRELLIRKNNKDKFTERINLYEISGFKLNRKSVTFFNKYSSNINIKF